MGSETTVKMDPNKAINGRNKAYPSLKDRIRQSGILDDSTDLRDRAGSKDSEEQDIDMKNYLEVNIDSQPWQHVFNQDGSRGKGETPNGFTAQSPDKRGSIVVNGKNIAETPLVRDSSISYKQNPDRHRSAMDISATVGHRGDENGANRSSLFNTAKPNEGLVDLYKHFQTPKPT